MWLEAGELAKHAVADSTLVGYATEVAEFREWCEYNGREFGTGGWPEADQLLADYMGCKCYVEEAPSYVGGRLLSAFTHFHPRMRKHLPEAARAAKAWAKLDPGSEREPIVEELVAAIVVTLTRSGYVEAGAVAWVAFDGLCRSQDWSKLLAGDVSDDGTHVAMEFGVQERGERSKTGHNQGVVARTQAARTFLRERKAFRRPQDKLFKLTPEEFRKQWQQAVRELGLEHKAVGPPHVLRHAGASHLSLREGWSLKDVKNRGRWSQDSSVKRYTKTHLVVKKLASLPNQVRQLGESFIQDPVKALRRATAKR